MASAALLEATLDEARFIDLMTKVIGESQHVQNGPNIGLIPQEDRVSNHVLDTLRPYMVESGGPLKVERISYIPGRGNVIITYPGTTAKTVAFVGSHMDVVPATPETWERNPFALTIEGDKMYGRGTTDCLGHVCVLTELFAFLGRTKPTLSVTVVGVFISSEEAGSEPHGCGVEGLVKNGHLEHLKGGPVFWVDSADSQPCIGTAGALQWHLKSFGKLMHSGLPHKGINSIELGMEAVSAMQKRFYADFPAVEMEAKYHFLTSSTMKPTQIECAKGGLNQICPWTTISGDIRLTPFYDVKTVKATVEGYIRDLNANLADIPKRGNFSTFELPTGEKGRVELTWGEHELVGVACKLDSAGHNALCQATLAVLGECKPYSICGSLPLVREMQDFGFDIQICGYGLMSVYHADNEYCHLSHMKNAYKIFANILAQLNV